MSGPRRIPLNATRAQPAQQAAFHPSSLDLVFSFSRSQAMYSANLDSPSFVQRYRRPGHPEDDESLPPSRDGSILTHTSDDDEEGEWSQGDDGDSLDQREISSWDPAVEEGLGPFPGEQLPKNAVRKPSQNSARRSASRNQLQIPQQQQAHAQPSGADATERTALLSKGGLSAPTQPNYARRQPSLDAGVERVLGDGLQQRRASRRLSSFSAEAWDELVEEHRGESTWGQTLFNTVNVLIGVGLLAEPLAFAQAGWVLGSVLLLFCAGITNYTGKMLARMMSRDASLKTYADVLIKAYGPRARTFIYLMFVVELGALSIALVVLFSDSMEALLPAWSSDAYKIVGFLIILPTTLLPLRFLSVTSLIGIVSSFTLFFSLLADGIIKKQAPGSLWHAMPTAAGPQWGKLPLSFGLLMSGFSGHAVIPSLYRDMKDPRHFDSMIDIAYLIAFVISMLMGSIGYCMFGGNVSSEVTRDMLATDGYPVGLNKLAMWMVALNPLVKYAVANRPLVQTFEVMIGLTPLASTHLADDDREAASTDVSPTRPPLQSADLTSSAIVSDDSLSSGTNLDGRHQPTNGRFRSRLPTTHPDEAPRTPWKVRIRTFTIRTCLTLAAVGLAVVIPNFDTVLSFLGAASAFLICCIGPIGAYLILGQRTPLSADAQGGLTKVQKKALVHEYQVKGWERAACWVLLVVSVGMSAVGTVWTFLPQE